MPALTCAPASLLSVKSCLNCLSEKELKAILGYTMRTYAGLTLGQVRTNSSCYCCMSKKDMLVALTAMFANRFAPALSVTELRAATRCSGQCASDKAIDAELLYLFCNYLQS